MRSKMYVAVNRENSPLVKKKKKKYIFKVPCFYILTPLISLSEYVVIVYQGIASVKIE